jgi:hypothetical protein
VRENIATPFSARLRNWGPLRQRHEKARVAEAVERLQIDTRAQGEVQRLSGGNQQKVTIGRWLAHGVQTLLLFDPTRGIDVRTKRQIYPLVREPGRTGGGDPLLHLGTRRGAAGLRPGRGHLQWPRRRSRGGDGGDRGTPDARSLRPCQRGGCGVSFVRKNAWTLGLIALFVVLLGVTR